MWMHIAGIQGNRRCHTCIQISITASNGTGCLQCACVAIGQVKLHIVEATDQIGEGVIAWIAARIVGSLGLARAIGVWRVATV